MPQHRPPPEDRHVGEAEGHDAQPERLRTQGVGCMPSNGRPESPDAGHITKGSPHQLPSPLPHLLLPVCPPLRWTRTPHLTEGMSTPYPCCLAAPLSGGPRHHTKLRECPHHIPAAWLPGCPPLRWTRTPYQTEGMSTPYPCCLAAWLPPSQVDQDTTLNRGNVHTISLLPGCLSAPLSGGPGHHRGRGGAQEGLPLQEVKVPEEM